MESDSPRYVIPQNINDLNVTSREDSYTRRGSIIREFSDSDDKYIPHTDLIKIHEEALAKSTKRKKYVVVFIFTLFSL